MSWENIDRRKAEIEKQLEFGLGANFVWQNSYFLAINQFYHVRKFVWQMLIINIVHNQIIWTVKIFVFIVLFDLVLVNWFAEFSASKCSILIFTLCTTKVGKTDFISMRAKKLPCLKVKCFSFKKSAPKLLEFVARFVEFRVFLCVFSVFDNNCICVRKIFELLFLGCLVRMIPISYAIRCTKLVVYLCFCWISHKHNYARAKNRTKKLYRTEKWTAFNFSQNRIATTEPLGNSIG